MNCGLVASKIDFEKDQAGPITNIVDDDDVGDTDTIMKDIKPKVGENSGTKKKPKRQPTVQIPPFLLGTKEISFTIKPHDPRKMKKYRENWNNGDGLVFDPSKQKHEVFQAVCKCFSLTPLFLLFQAKERSVHCRKY